MNVELIQEDLSEAVDGDPYVTVIYGSTDRIHKGQAVVVDDTWLCFTDPPARIRLDAIIAYWYHE